MARGRKRMISERHIELFILHPDRLDEEERKRVEQAIARDEALQSLAHFYQTYQEVSEHLAHSSDRRADAFVNALFPEEATVPLHTLPKLGIPPGVTVLAAASKIKESRRFKTICTVASADNQLLIRIVQDAEKDEYRLYTMAEAYEDRAHAFISFPELGLDFITDEEGQLVFTLDEEHAAIDWTRVQAYLRLPVAMERFWKHTLEQGTVKRSLISEHQLVVKWQAGALNIQIYDGDYAIHRVLYMPDNDSRILVSLREGKARISIEELPEHFTLRFYQ